MDEHMEMELQDTTPLTENAPEQLETSEPMQETDSSIAEKQEATEEALTAGNSSGGDPVNEDAAYWQKVDAAATKRLNEFIRAQYGHIKNPYTGKMIDNVAEYQNYRTQFEAEERSRKLKEAGINEKALTDAISNHPIVKHALEVEKAQETQRVQLFMQDELKKVVQKYPECGIKEIGDFRKTPEGREALEMWRRGVPLEKAYAATHMDELLQKRSQAVKQGALNDLNSKNHMKQPKGGVPGGSVPADVAEGFRMYYPGISDAEILEKYNKYKD